MSIDINKLVEWKFVIPNNDVFGSIIITSPTGKVVVVSRLSNSPGCVLHELAEAILRTRNA